MPRPPLRHNRVPGLVLLLCDDRHDHVRGSVILLLYKRGLCLIHQLCHNHVSGLVLLFYHSRGLGVVSLLCLTGTMSDPFDGVCPTLDLDVDLRRLYSKLMEKLDSLVYFCSWVTKWTRERGVG